MDTTYREQLKIDKFSLDEEAAEQSFLFVHWAEKYAEIADKKDRLETEFDRLKGVKDAYFRKKLGGDAKEKAIAYSIMGDPKVQELQEELFTVKKEESILKAVKLSFEGRKTMIRVLADLWLGEYYSDLQVKQEQADHVKDRLGKLSSKKRRQQR